MDVDRVVELHSRVVADQATTSDHPPGCIEAALGTAANTALYLSDTDEPDPLQLAALVVRNLGARHCFTDGNKRVAWAVLIDLLAREGLALEVDQEEAAEMVLELVRNELDVQDFVDWLAEHLVAHR